MIAQNRKSILFLGKKKKNFFLFIKKKKLRLIHCNSKISLKKLDTFGDIDFIISFNYPYIVNDEIINKFKDRIINCHISYLPWNRGADPNFWSHFDQTPKGVTIHRISKKIDSGNILIQKKVFFNCNLTLKTSYKILNDKLEKLLIQNFVKILNKKIKSKKQCGDGTLHFKKDKYKFFKLLKNGYNTKIKNIVALGKMNDKNKE